MRERVNTTEGRRQSRRRNIAQIRIAMGNMAPNDSTGPF
jgi:hypothetical protein